LSEPLQWQTLGAPLRACRYSLSTTDPCPALLPVELLAVKLPLRFFLTLAVALAYACAGWLSMQVSIPPYYVSLVFIPAGVALGAVLVFGTFVLPGVMLGSLAVQWMASGQAGLSDWPWTLLVSPIGAALQAWVTAQAVRRWVGYPSEFDTPRRTLLFLVVLVPLGHMVNASLSVPLLVHGQVIGVEDALFSWWSWWQGDALGAVLFTPLLLVAFGQPAEAWRTRWKTVALPMLVALGVVGVAFHQIQASQERALSQHFHQEAEALTERLQRRLHVQTDSVLAVARLMEVASDRSDAVFRRATAAWLERYPATQNYAWYPHLLHAQRAVFEQQASMALDRPYQIRTRTGEGLRVVSPDEPVYMPIRFVQPLVGNEAALGLDVLNLRDTRPSVLASVNTGLPQVTPGFRLVQETGEQRGVVMYQAVYEPDGGGMPRRGWEGLQGVVAGAFRMDDMLRSVMGDAESVYLDTDYFSVCLIDPGAALDNQRLSGAPGCGGDVAPHVRYFSSLPVQFGERTWLFQIASGPRFDKQDQGWAAWGTLTVSLLAVAMLGAFLMVLTGQTRRTEQLVVERTRELAQSNAGLQELAMFDPLTGLANRLHWTTEARKALDSAVRHGDRLAVVFVDLDHFKDVNDSLGHSMGDLLLRSVAQRLQACLRAHDLMARQGGDEFVVLLGRLSSRDDAAVVATKMVEALTAPFMLHSHEVRVSASLGLDWFEGSDGPCDAETLLRHADMAMYQAKAAGRNGWCFYLPEMDHSVTQRLMVESGLRRALVNDELVLHYQPQVNCHTGAVVGVEALVRWQHPELGLLSPDRFVPQAENSGQIDELGAWVMRRACQQLGEWQEAGITDLTMAVNVSAVEFARPGFIPRLRQVLADTGTDPCWLELEITETALMQALPELVERLGEIAHMGVSLSLDDFGTGYSSLGYLKRLPLHRLKIDRSFVRDLPGDKEDEAIVLATLSMARALDLEVVAEGVEMGAQRSFLASHGCDYIQGWLVARPMDGAAFEAWWRAHTPRT